MSNLQTVRASELLATNGHLWKPKTELLKMEVQNPKSKELKQPLLVFLCLLLMQVGLGLIVVAL